MTITYLKSIGSTQKYLKTQLQEKKIDSPYAVVSDVQTDGIGSRDNIWMGLEGNLFLSFSVLIEDLADDLKLESSSIYFSYLLKSVLSELGSKVWLKWPNDFYIENTKIGGMITNIVNDSIVCGVGINLKKAPKEFRVLDVVVQREVLLEKYFKLIDKRVSWKQVFSKYKIEFGRNQGFFTHNNSLKISLAEAILQNDGSVIINGERIYSTR